MESLKTNFDNQQKVNIISAELDKLEQSLEKKSKVNYDKAKKIEQIHNESMEYLHNILKNLN